MAAEKDNIDEVFAYGDRASRGGARFLSEKKMWDYMGKHAGKHVHELLGQQVFVNVYNMDGTIDPKQRAMNKVVRVIVEQNGGDGKTIKRSIEKNKASGEIWWQNEQVAKWDEVKNEMELMGAALQYQDAFRKLI